MQRRPVHFEAIFCGFMQVGMTIDEKFLTLKHALMRSMMLANWSSIVTIFHHRLVGQHYRVHFN
uniref:Uncharacterized protein n=1 Tax=Arundo donax TaxID=35708 RepID=A0A0A8Y9Q0_ARUDO